MAILWGEDSWDRAPYEKKDFCKRGHAFNHKNTKLQKIVRNNKVYFLRSCQACRAMRYAHKYKYKYKPKRPKTCNLIDGVWWKTCGKCKQSFTFDNFYTKENGLFSRCKTCCIEYDRLRRSKRKTT